MKKFVEEIRKVIHSKSLKASGVVFIGKTITAAAGILFTVIVVRKLGPAQYGLFSLCMAVFYVLTELSDLGMVSSLVRFVSRHLAEDKEKADAALKVALKIRTVISLVLFVACILFAGNIATAVFKKPEIEFPLRLVAFGILFTVFFNYISSILQAQQDFGRYSLLFAIMGVLKAAGTVLLLVSQKITLIAALLVNVLVPLAGSIIGWAWIPKHFLGSKGDERKAFLELFHFGKWMIAVSVYGLLMFRMDVVMINHYCAIEQVGYYSAAMQLNLFFSLVIGSMMTVLFPVMSSKPDREELKYLLNRVTRAAVFTSVIAILPAMILSGPVITGVLGKEYAASVLPFKILFVNQLIVLIFSPVGLVFLSMNKPQILSVVCTAMLIANVGLNLVLIPPYQAVGAALSTTIVQLMGYTATCFMAIYLLRRDENGKE